MVKINEQRKYSGCAVLERNIVVPGGFYDIDFNSLNTVESNDVIANKWSSMLKIVHHHNYLNLIV